MELLFHVTKQNISRKDDNVVVSNSVKYLKAKFDFETDWNVSNNICPIFRKGGEFAGYLPEFVNGKFLDEQKSCYVPIEVLNTEGRFFVSIFDFTNGQRITTNEVAVEVTRSGPVLNSPTIYSLDLRFENENLQLTANGEAVGAGVEIPKQEIDNMMSDTSENPVQNKVAKAYTDEKTKAIPTDISLSGRHLQLTANGEAVGDGVNLPSGGNWRKIVDITVSAEQAGVNVLESYLDITKEDLAKINRLMFFCKLPCDGSYAIRQVEIQASIKPSVDGTYYQILCYKGNNFQATESGRTLFAMSTADLAYEYELVRCHDASLYATAPSENTAPREIIYNFKRERLTANVYTPHLYVTTTNMPIVENAVVQLYVM